MTDQIDNSTPAGHIGSALDMLDQLTAGGLTTLTLGSLTLGRLRGHLTAARDQLGAAAALERDAVTPVPSGTARDALEYIGRTVREDWARPSEVTFGALLAAVRTGLDDLDARDIGQVTARGEVDAEPPEPQIEVLPLPGDRFMLVLSQWPANRVPSVEQGAKLKADTGAASVMVTDHKVWLPDGLRSGHPVDLEPALSADAMHVRGVQVRGLD